MVAPKCVLITGATGDIGRKLRKHLSATGRYKLRLLCLDASEDPDVTSADLRVYDDTWTCLFDGVDAVVHLANARAPLMHWESFNADNIGMLVNVYNAAASHGVGRVVYASSVWTMYGYRFRAGMIHPNMPADPGGSPYGMAKILGERVAKAFFERCGITTIGLRIGACLPGDATPDAYLAMSGWNQDCWISNRDVCQGIEKAILAENISFAVLNLTSNNVPARWSLRETEEAIGYRAQDSHTSRVCLRRRLEALVVRFLLFTMPAFAARLIPWSW